MVTVHIAEGSYSHLYLQQLEKCDHRITNRHDKDIPCYHSTSGLQYSACYCGSHTLVNKHSHLLKKTEQFHRQTSNLYGIIMALEIIHSFTSLNYNISQYCYHLR